MAFAGLRGGNVAKLRTSFYQSSSSLLVCRASRFDCIAQNQACSSQMRYLSGVTFPRASLLFSNLSISSRRFASTNTNGTSALTWNDFLRLRKIRRRFHVSSSVVLSIISLGAGVGLLQDQNLEQLGQMFFGLDPMFVMALWTIGFVGAGWLLGPSLGGGLFRIVYRSRLSEMQLKERDFFNRIRKYRVDPTSSSMQNPVPDYYGEKISSVAGYRQWLKDQRAFNKKRQSFV